MADDVVKKVVADARTDERGMFDVLSLTEGGKTGIDLLSDTKNQYIQVIHTNIFESSRVELNCLDANGKMTRSEVTTDDYPKIVGNATLATDMRLSTGDGQYILDAIQKSTGKDPKELLEELANSPNKVSLSYADKSPLDEICNGPVGQAIQKASKER